MKKIEENMMMAAKLAFFVYIVISPFINHQYLSYLNAVGAKVFLILLIVAASFVDLQLAIIMTLALLVLVINLNKDAMFKSSPPPMRQKVEHFSVGMPVMDTITEFPDKCQDMKVENTAISQDLYNLYLDPKIKPYEMFMRQLSSPEFVEKAGSGAF